MYEPPIKVVQGELETQLEGEILKAVHRVGVTVDRDELIRALRYDREQYQKGFDDAREDAVVVTRCKGCVHWDDDPDTYGTDDGPKGKCMKSFETMYADDFCSYGDPKKGTTQSIRP